MTLQNRLKRMEEASPSPRLVLIDAKDEEDYSRQREKVFLSHVKHAPCLVDLEIHLDGEVRREQMNILPFEEMLALLD